MRKGVGFTQCEPLLKGVIDLNPPRVTGDDDTSSDTRFKLATPSLARNTNGIRLQ